MKKSILSLILLTTIYADSYKHYLGVGASITQANTHTIKKECMTDLTLKYGYSLFKMLDLEARGSFFLGGGEKLYHPSSLGVFLKPNLDITSRANFYTLLGYSKNTLSKQDSTAVNAVTIQEDFSFGAGAEYNLFSDGMFGYIDFVRYIDKTTTKPEGKYAIKIDSLSLGVNFKFAKEAKNKELQVVEKPLEETYVTLSKAKVKVEPVVLIEEVKEFPEFEIYDDKK